MVQLLQLAIRERGQIEIGYRRDRKIVLLGRVWGESNLWEYCVNGSHVWYSAHSREAAETNLARAHGIHDAIPSTSANGAKVEPSVASTLDRWAGPERVKQAVHKLILRSRAHAIGEERCLLRGGLAGMVREIKAVEELLAVIDELIDKTPRGTD